MYSELVKKIRLVMPEDGYTPEVGHIVCESAKAQLERGMVEYNVIYIPAGLTRLHLLALCSLTHLPIYMGNRHGQPFNASNQSYGHTMNGNDISHVTEKGIIEAIGIFNNKDYWTENNEKMMSVEEVLYVIFSNRQTGVSPEVWCPKEGKIIINCREDEALVYYDETGWEIQDYIDGERGLERRFIPLE